MEIESIEYDYIVLKEAGLEGNSDEDYFT